MKNTDQYIERDNVNSGTTRGGSQQKETTSCTPRGRFESIVLKLFNRETLLYGVFGVLTTLLNLGLFRLLLFFQLNYKLANIITLIVVKLVAYIVNKVFVFQSHTDSIGVLLKEFFRYFVTRGFTMLVDYFGLIILVDLLGLGEMVGKCITTFVVVVLNYFLGKYIVFTGGKSIETDAAKESPADIVRPE